MADTLKRWDGTQWVAVALVNRIVAGGLTIGWNVEAFPLPQLTDIGVPI